MIKIDYLVLLFTLAVVLIVGWASSKRSRSASSAKEFLMAGKGINKLQAGFSMAATDFGGSGLVGAIGYSYAVGMSGAWWNLAAAPAFLLVGLFLAKKLNSMNCSTLPEYFGKRYGCAVRYLSCGMHLLSNVASLAVQFTVSCTVLHVVTGMDMRVSLIISFLIVILLTSGGLRTVVNTDATMFVVIVLSVLIAVPVSFRAAGGHEVLFAQLPDGFLRLDQLGIWTPLSWILLCMLSYSTSQTYIQRMVSAKNEGTATFGALFTAGFYIVISLALGLIGVASHVLLPGIADTNAIFPTMLVRFFPHGWLGLGLAAVLAATISTGTSILHATATLFVNDLYLPIFAKSHNEKKELLVSRISVLVLAAFALVISLFSGDIVTICYVGGLFYSVSAFMPMVLGLNTRFVTSTGALVSIVVTVLVSLGWEYIPQLHVGILANLPSNVIGLVFSAIILCAVSLIGNQSTPDQIDGYE